MHSKQSANGNSPVSILYDLCQHVLSKEGRAMVDDDVLSKQFQFALKMIGSQFDPSISCDEFQLIEKIKRKFVRQKKESDAAIFSSLHRKLQSKGSIQNGWGIIYLLDLLSNASSKQQRDQNVFFGNGLPAFSSTPFTNSLPYRGQLSASSMPESSSSSGIGSKNSDSKSLLNNVMGMQSFTSQQARGTPDLEFRPSKPEKRLSAVATLAAHSLNISKRTELDDTSSRSAISFPMRSGSFMLKSAARDRVDGAKFEVTEKLLLRDILFVFQGIEGQMIRFDDESDGFCINSNIGVPFPIRDFIDKLNELGWLFRKVRKFLDARVGDKALGLVGQAFCAAIHKELGEYYRLLAVLEAQQNSSDTNNAKNGLTLRRLMVWTNDPLIRMKTLATLVDLCKGKKGGALLSAIYSNTKIGDPYLRNLMKKILNAVSHPIKSILERWIYEGELQDIFHEFFIAADPAVRNERLWHEKYSLRKLMVPSFIPLELATRILNIGKSINFIRVVCKDREPIGDQAIINAGNDTGYSKDLKEFTSSALEEIIDIVYKKTSQRLLEILFNKYNFLDHLQAMRRYLLLGQGDFIRHLMDLLQSDLAKPANTLYMHNLTGVLEAAIRSTNAQYDEADILKRLDCRLLEISPGDCGWDVFSLDYHVDGPISTIFTPDCMLYYLRIFNFLWRAKRMEYCLTEIWKNQMAYNKLLRNVPEIAPLLHQSNCLEAEMVHFIHQMQYYITFEVLECCWEELLNKVREAKDLDHVIAAHETFLDQVMTRALLDNESRTMLTQLRAIFDLIIQFQNTQESMYNSALNEMKARQNLDKLADKRSSEGVWGMTDVDTDAEYKRSEDFQRKFIPSTRAQLRVLHQSYQDMLQQFLIMLDSHSDLSLRFLSFRLDFNEHYKNKEPRLRTPMSRHSKRYANQVDLGMSIDLKF